MKRLDISKIKGVHIFEITKFSDERGWLMELFRSDELEIVPDMSYISATLPGVMRGPHEHEEQTDLFLFVGPGEFELHLWGFMEESDGGSQWGFMEESDWGSQSMIHEVYNFGQDCPRSVVVPPGVIHGYRCVSDTAGIVFNAPDRLYGGPGRLYPVDEIRHEDDPDHVEWLLGL